MFGTPDSHPNGPVALQHPPAPPAALKQRRAEGKALRQQTPRSAHAKWEPAPERPDPIALLERSSAPRVPDLVPVRYGRMLANPFTYLRGSPIVMAGDLAHTPTSGLRVQVCGDAHLMNFGVFASPERNLLFDLTDFDETLPGPWEWDLKRLAASFVVAGRVAGLRRKDASDVARACVGSYRERMDTFAEMGVLEVWYSHVDAGAALEVFQQATRKAVARELQKARRRNSLQSLAKLTETVDGKVRIRDDAPLICHVEDPSLGDKLRSAVHGYRATLQDDRRHLLERYHLVDWARKVVGVGSVGTRCLIALLDSGQGTDPLFLQVKEAEASVLEPHLGKSGFGNHGQRVVAGQRLMQSASDIFLGWFRAGDHDYYVRQLRDMKGTAYLPTMNEADLICYAGLCGWVLARAHARSGDPARLAGYLGRSEALDDSLTACADALANQTERDYDAFCKAVRSGRLPAIRDLEENAT